MLCCALFAVLFAQPLTLFAAARSRLGGHMRAFAPRKPVAMAILLAAGEIGLLGGVGATLPSAHLWSDGGIGSSRLCGLASGFSLIRPPD